MFTGLIEAVGEVAERRPTSGGFRLRVATALASEVSTGDSVAVNGVCLTVILADGKEIHADIGPETARVTTLGAIERGAHVNLERPLGTDGRFGGHFVQGHVDGVGRVLERRHDAEFDWLTVGFPAALAPYLIPKGSIAVDGISLTVAGLATDRFDIMVIPFTLEHTNLQYVHEGDSVNLECDMVGKYVVRAAQLAGLALPALGSTERTRG